MMLRQPEPDWRLDPGAGRHLGWCHHPENLVAPPAAGRSFSRPGRGGGRDRAIGSPLSDRCYPSALLGRILAPFCAPTAARSVHILT